VERLHQLARYRVVARLDCIQNPVDELGPKPIFLIDRRLSLLLGGGGGDVLALAHA